MNIIEDKIFNDWKLDKVKKQREKKEEDTHKFVSFKIELEERPEDKEEQHLRMKKVRKNLNKKFRKIPQIGKSLNLNLKKRKKKGSVIAVKRLNTSLD